tara:strand:- start:236 stop:829 length:594 start_codon:yes stop_codon:yes gene_type:complete
MNFFIEVKENNPQPVPLSARGSRILGNDSVESTWKLSMAGTSSLEVTDMQVKPTPADERNPSPVGRQRAEPLLNLVAEDGPVMEAVAAASMQRVITAVLDRVASQGAARGLRVLAHSFQDNVLQEDDGSIRLSNGARPPWLGFAPSWDRIGMRVQRTGTDLVSLGRAYGNAAHRDALALRCTRDRRAGVARGRCRSL